MWKALVWPASALVTAFAAWQPLERTRAVRLEGRRLLVLPLAAVIAALVLLFVDHFHRLTDVAAVLACATLVMAGARLWLTLGEHMTLLGTSRGEATTDELTGIGNRRRLTDELATELRSVTRARPLLLMLFDLNRGVRLSRRDSGSRARGRRVAAASEASTTSRARPRRNAPGAPIEDPSRQSGSSSPVYIAGGGRRNMRVSASR